MRKTYNFVVVVCFLLMVSCNNQAGPENTEEVIWALGWRMIESTMNDDLALAESQFDSLLNFNQVVNDNFLIKGIEIKSKLNKVEEVEQILRGQKPETLIDLCQRNFLIDWEPCQNIEKFKPNNEALQLELIKMFINDQYVRCNLMTDLLEKYDLNKNEVLADSFGINMDVRNRIRLNEIIEEFGFPNRKMFGKDAMNGIFYIIQHADRDKEWQRSQLANIEKSVKAGDLDGQSYAYLYDRIKINAGEKQLYGTQFSKVDASKNIAILAEIENIEMLADRRRKFGMMPIEMYKRVMLKNAF